jgi:hypothetical protein
MPFSRSPSLESAPARKDCVLAQSNGARYRVCSPSVAPKAAIAASSRAVPLSRQPRIASARPRRFGVVAQSSGARHAALIAVPCPSFRGLRYRRTRLPSRADCLPPRGYIAKRATLRLRRTSLVDEVFSRLCPQLLSALAMAVVWRRANHIAALGGHPKTYA